MAGGKKPDWSYQPYDPTPEDYHSNWNPLHWPLWAKIAAAVATAAVIATAIAVAVVEVKANKYPDYTTLTYSLQDTYQGTDFFSNFVYFDTYDPSDGFVHYVPEATANSSQYNLTYATSTAAVLRVDTTDTDASTGRYSVRITSTNTYNDGLFIFDIVHTPYGCSTWPALWMSDVSNWPTNGEIDILEAVNQATTGNQMTLHTTEGCTMNVKRKETGTPVYTNCLNSTNDNAGCGVKGADATFGPEFNDNGGGIYAMELRDAGIRVWMFTRDNIPDDIADLTTSASSASPNPEAWGEALADFPSTDCDISTHFKNLTLIANIDLCGDWAGETSVYSTEDGCPGTCEEFVTSNNTAFDTAYWEWNGWWVFSASS